MPDTSFPTNPVLPSDLLSLTKLAGAGLLARSAGGRSPGAVEEAAKDFESVLLYKLLEEMKRTIPDSGLLGGGAAKQVQGMFWYYLAQEIADQGGLGLWKDVYREFARGVEAAAGPPSPLPPVPQLDLEQ